MTTLGFGWLASDQGLPDTIASVFVPTYSVAENAPFPTRRSEYRFFMLRLYDQPRGTKVLDLGSGFNPEIHLLPEILASMGFLVTAIDAEVSSLSMPHHERVTRHVDDITDLALHDESYDYVTYCSVLEHLSTADQTRTLSQAHRLLKPGGLLLVTTDETEPDTLRTQLAIAAFQVGDVVPLRGEQLSPRVAWAVVQKQP